MQQRLWPDPQPLVERLGREFFRALPPVPGVYLMRDRADVVLYVGKAKSLRHRLSSYRVANPERMKQRTLRLLRLVEQIAWEECADEAAALRRESELLLTLKPRFNRAGVWRGPDRFLSWRTRPEGLELAVEEGEAMANGWQRAGPFGGQARPLHRALVRLLWCRLHPAAGLAGMPAGWWRGGHLNNGIIEPSQVKGIVAAGLEARGIRTTCLGFGRSYDEVLLGELAKSTNGEFYDADSPERLPAIFEHELQGLQSVSVQNLRLRLKRLDFCEAIAGLNEYPCVELPDGRWEYAVGDLVCEEERVAVFALQVLPLPAIDGTPVTSLAGEHLLEVELVYDEITAEGIGSRTVTQVVRVQSTQDPAEVRVNETVLSWVAVQQAARAVRESTRLAREGDLAGARACLSGGRRAMSAAPFSGAMQAGLELLEKAAAELAPTNADELLAMKKLYALRHRAARASSRPEPKDDPGFRGDPKP